MKITTLLSAAFAAATLAGVSAANAAPAPNNGGYVSRAVRAPNGKDVFVRVVKVPRAQALAQCACPMTDTAHGAQPQAANPAAQG
jgi:hypothetical protein